MLHCRGSGMQVGGTCKYIQCTLLHSARVWGLATSVLTPWGPENNQVPLRTPVSAHTVVVAFPSTSSHLKKGEKKEQRSKRERKD
jgi:hypothetical protein